MQLFKLGLLSFGSLLLFNSLAQAAPIPTNSNNANNLVVTNSATATLRQPASRNTIKESFFPIPQSGGCPSRQIQFFQAETQNYIVYICGETAKYPDTYTGVAKNGREKITLPLLRAQPNFFAAVNDNITYTLNSNYLTIFQGEKPILQQRVQRYNSLLWREPGAEQTISNSK
jgi:hypothetical protein